MTSNLKTILEALLFVADAPLSLAQLADLVDSHSNETIKKALEELSQEYDFTERAFTLVQVAGGYLLRTRPEMAYWLRRLRRQQVTRLSRAALESLAIVAYKQPVLKAEIERLRGVEVGGILRTLLNKGLIKVVGRKDLPGRPLIYGTTKRFLEVFDLSSLKDLPTLEEMAELGGEGPEDEPSLFDALSPETRQELEDLQGDEPDQEPSDADPEEDEAPDEPDDLPPDEPEAA